MIAIPEYEKYSLLELYRVLNSVRGDLYPDVYEALRTEVDSREPLSVMELEDCYFVLDKAKHPEYAAKLVDQIYALGGPASAHREAITAEKKYKTFWRRFWAHFLDGFVVGIPSLIVILVLRGAGLLQDDYAPYVDQLLQFLGLSYFIVMHAKYGQTVGKMATQVKVLHKSEQAGITLMQSIIRDIVPVLALAVSLVYLIAYGASSEMEDGSMASRMILYATGFTYFGWWIAEITTMLFNARRRALHDFIARTVVVRVP